MKNIYLVLTALFALNMTSAVFANEPAAKQECAKTCPPKQVVAPEADADETVVNEEENEATEEKA